MQSFVLPQARAEYASEMLENIHNMPTYHTDYVRKPRPCECPECQNHFYSLEEQFIDRWTYTKDLSTGEAKAVLKKWTEQLHNDRMYLKENIEKYGDVIMARWKKRTQQKRAALLLEADPNLCQETFFYIRYNFQEPHWHEVRKRRSFFLSPYLDTETLKKNPAVLLALLEYRARYHPQEWALFDSQQLVGQFALGYLDVQYNKDAVVMYGPNYGSLTAWDREKAHRNDVIGFPRGSLIIETQARLMAFLRKVAGLLLENLDPEETTSCVKWNELIQQGPKASGEVANWSQYTHQPFSAPPRFDIDALVTQVKARVNASADHLWLLQTDPSYLRRYLGLLEQTDVISSVPSKTLGRTIMISEIQHDIMVHWSWKDVLSEFEHARNMLHRYRDSIQPGQPLPKKFDDALGALELYLVNLMLSDAKHLQAVIPQRPGFKDLFEFTHNVHDGTTTMRRKVPDVNNESVFRNEPLYWCLTQVISPPDDQRSWSKSMLFEFLDEHLSNSPAKERARLDELLYQKFSNYATIHELLTAVRYHMPKNAIREVDETKVKEHRRAWQRSGASYRGQDESLRGLRRPDKEAVLRKLRYTPLPSGRKDQQWLEKFNNIHSLLQDLWKGIHNSHKLWLEGFDIPAELIESDLGDIRHWDGAVYHHQLEAKRQEILAQMAKPKGSSGDDIYIPLPTGVIENQLTKLSISEPKKRTKTRGAEIESSDAASNKSVAASTTTGAAAPQITVAKRSYATFRSMYPETPEERLKSVEWETFVASMQDAGFSAKNGGGSIVTFEDNAGAGKIIFHRPHPDPKVDPVMLQSMGRRLNKWFGWDRSVFTLAGK